MRMYELLLLNRSYTGFLSTKSRYFMAIPSAEVANQYALDEERRSGMDVYLKPLVGETLDLVLFTRLEVEVPDAEPCIINIFKEREVSHASPYH